MSDETLPGLAPVENAATDPAIAERHRAHVQLGASAPMRPRAMQHSTMGLGLFDRIDAPGLDL